MKRSWLGVGLLVILLFAGVMSTKWIRATHEEMARYTREAAQSALREDWAGAAERTGRVRERWEQCWRLSAALSNHAPLEQIETLFAQLEVYAAAEETVAFASGCTQLGAELQALADAQQLNWWNML